MQMAALLNRLKWKKSTQDFHKTAIMASQAYNLDILNKNRELLMKLLEMKADRQLSGVHALTLNWKQSSESDVFEEKLLPKEGIYKVSSGLPSDRRYHAVISEVLQL